MATYFEWNDGSKIATIFSRLDSTMLWSGKCDNFQAACKLSNAFMLSFTHGRMSGLYQAKKQLIDLTDRLSEAAGE